MKIKVGLVVFLYDLQEYHGVVLHPNEPRVWVLHSFSLAPTSFYVRRKDIRKKMSLD